LGKTGPDTGWASEAIPKMMTKLQSQITIPRDKPSVPWFFIVPSPVLQNASSFPRHPTFGRDNQVTHHSQLRWQQ
jgi:hypothetical protein